MPQTSGYHWTFAKADVETTASQLIAATGLRAAHGILIRALSTNASNVIVGNKDAQFFILEPGDSIELEVDDPSLIWLKSAAGTMTVNFAIV